ncbi:MAG: DNA methylase [Erysipelotrichaceae bacterium]
MNAKNSTYICIDLKSFYASVECVERKLDPMTTNLVVADQSRTDKSICLAATPSLKSFGVKGRSRLFEVKQRLKQVNYERQIKYRNKLKRKSWNIDEINEDPSVEVDFIIAPPRMAHYIEYSSRVFDVYLKYVAMEDIHIYSVDEVFIDVTSYLRSYGLTAYELANKIIKDVLQTTKITATAGIANNLYLAKVAMDILAKHIPADKDGIRIAELNEHTYREQLWNHEPLTDFWRVGKGYAKKLQEYGITTMGEIARCSLGSYQDKYNEAFLYKLFGVNAELLIDHAWGVEPCEMKMIKSYQPQATSIGSGQVLHSAYTYDKARIVLREMVESLALKLADLHLMSSSLTMTIGYDIENLTDTKISEYYQGAITVDPYGRKIPKHAHGIVHFNGLTSSQNEMAEAALKKFEQIVDDRLYIRRLNIAANQVTQEVFNHYPKGEQLNLFEDQKDHLDHEVLLKQREKENKAMKAMNTIKKKYGGNAILKASSLSEGATQKERNQQIGGHKA